MTVIFSKWFQWKHREEIKNCTLPGVYILAKFKNTPKGEINKKDKKIIYIGETCTSLKKRWNQFNNAAFKAQDTHTGGTRYKKKYNDNGHDLFVAAFPVQMSHFIDQKIRDYFIRYIERKLIYEFVEKHGSQQLELNKQ